MVAMEALAVFISSLKQRMLHEDLASRQQDYLVREGVSECE
jgi:hypothetical protein